MSKRFLTGLRLVNLAEDPASGAEGELYFNTTSFQVRMYADGAWTDVAIASLTAEEVLINVKNTSGGQLTKGTPVYITGSVGASDTLTVSAANANSASTMPAVGLLTTTLAQNGQGHAQVGGFFKGIDTDIIDGQVPISNQTVYVKAGGGLTLTKPTGTNLIQNIAKVARVHSTNGSLIVSSIMRTNDIPNIASGHFWLGNASAVPVASNFTTEVNRSASATYLTIASASATYATTSAAFEYASSASAHVNSLSQIRDDALDSRLDILEITPIGGGIVTASVPFSLIRSDNSEISLPEGYIWLDEDGIVESVTSAGVVTLNASEPSSPVHGMVWIDRDASVATMIVSSSELQSQISSASANANVLSQARDNLKADLASPSFTGTPTAPTAAAGTNTTQIATTAYSFAAASSASANVNTLAIGYASSASANANVLSQARDNLKADLASPSFTGTPTAPTAAAGTNTTQIATTAYSFAAASSASANASVRVQTDNVERLFLALC